MRPMDLGISGILGEAHGSRNTECRVQFIHGDAGKLCGGGLVHVVLVVRQSEGESNMHMLIAIKL